MMLRNDYTIQKSISFNSNKYCYIYKCKARCCANAPLPKHYIEHSNIRNKIVRKMFAVLPAPPNNPYCMEAVIPVTKPLEEYAIKAGKTKNGETVWTLNTGDIFSDPENYCPFIKENGRCNIYKQRPPVCRDFGVVKGYECDLQLTFKELMQERWKIQKEVLRNIFSLNRRK